MRLGVNGERLAQQHRAAAMAFAQNFSGPVKAARRRGAKTLGQIAADLNSVGLRTRQGSAWTTGAVHRLLGRLEDSTLPSNS